MEEENEKKNEIGKIDCEVVFESNNINNKNDENSSLLSKKSKKSKLDLIKNEAVVDNSSKSKISILKMKLQKKSNNVVDNGFKTDIVKDSEHFEDLKLKKSKNPSISSKKSKITHATNKSKKTIINELDNNKNDETKNEMLVDENVLINPIDNIDTTIKNTNNDLNLVEEEIIIDNKADNTTKDDNNNEANTDCIIINSVSNNENSNNITIDKTDNYIENSNKELCTIIPDEIISVPTKNEDPIIIENNEISNEVKSIENNINVTEHLKNDQTIPNDKKDMEITDVIKEVTEEGLINNNIDLEKANNNDNNYNNNINLIIKEDLITENINLINNSTKENNLKNNIESENIEEANIMNNHIDLSINQEVDMNPSSQNDKTLLETKEVNTLENKEIKIQMTNLSNGNSISTENVAKLDAKKDENDIEYQQKGKKKIGEIIKELYDFEEFLNNKGKEYNIDLNSCKNIIDDTSKVLPISIQLKIIDQMFSSISKTIVDKS